MTVIAGCTRSWKVSRETEKNNILGQEVEALETCSISLLRSKLRALLYLGDERALYLYGPGCFWKPLQPLSPEALQDFED